ncbi:hypothetical protein N9917_04050 [Deltaproteobacteria bacterium]|nr:hypothetical protein [Deltaproteobacteria bacterium]
MDKVERKITTRCDMSGRIFGSLLVIGKVHDDDPLRGATKWHCVCKCGETSKPVTTHLIRGLSQSCGCKIKGGRAAKKAMKATTDKRRQKKQADYFDNLGKVVK